MKISSGFTEKERTTVARLYWSAFGDKLGKVMGPAERAEAFFARVLNPDYALAARDDTGRLLGIAGFKTTDGGLVDGGLHDLARTYGWFGGLWRGLVLSVLERDLAHGVFQMDGIFVKPEGRGQGVGTALLQAIAQTARDKGAVTVSLDVIDTNPRAKALYERQGFKAVSTENLGMLRHIFGFKSATKMSLTL